MSGESLSRGVGDSAAAVRGGASANRVADDVDRDSRASRGDSSGRCVSRDVSVRVGDRRAQDRGCELDRRARDDAARVYCGAVQAHSARGRLHVQRGNSHRSCTDIPQRFATYGAGGGITIDSRADAEFDEAHRQDGGARHAARAAIRIARDVAADQRRVSSTRRPSRTTRCKR